MPPLNLVGDFGGGGMFLAVGLLAAVLHARETGVGPGGGCRHGRRVCTVDNGDARSYRRGLVGAGAREANLLDGGAPFYAVYETADGGHVAVGALEPQFFAALLEGLGIDQESLPAQGDREGWPMIKAVLAAKFASRSRDEWAEHFAQIDACVAPVLDATEAPGSSPQQGPRGVHRGRRGHPARSRPQILGYSCPVPSGPGYPGRDTDFVLKTLGYNETETSMLRRVGAVA